MVFGMIQKILANLFIGDLLSLNLLLQWCLSFCNYNSYLVNSQSFFVNSLGSFGE